MSTRAFPSFVAVLLASTSLACAQVNSGQGVIGGPGVIDFMGRKGHIQIQSSDLPNVPAARLPAFGGGDCTSASGTTVLACTKTGGVPFAPSATTDTTNAGNIGSGTLSGARLPTPGSTSLGGVKAAAGAAHQYQTGIDNTGMPLFAQPSGADLLANTVGSGQLAPGAAVGNLGYAPLNKAGDGMTGDLSSTASLLTKTIPTCNTLSGSQATDGTQSFVMSCFGAWMNPSPTYFGVAPTRGTFYSGGIPQAVMNTGFLIQSWADGNSTDNVDGRALNFQSIGGTVSAGANPQNNAVADFISVRQAPDGNGNRPPQYLGK